MIEYKLYKREFFIGEYKFSKTIYLLCPPTFNTDLYDKYGFYFVERLVVDSISYRFIFFEPTLDPWMSSSIININGFEFYREIVDRTQIINFINLLIDIKRSTNSRLADKILKTSMSILNTILFTL